MGHSRKSKADSHDRIVRIAAARIRESGVDSVGVADLMREAGLTHGGFYRHFASREELVAEAIERALTDGGKGAVEAVAQSKLGKQELFGALVDWYLSTAHRDDLATSCAVTSLARDVAHGNDRARSAYTRQVSVYLDLFTQLLADDEQSSARAKAIGAWATMVGAVSMARAINDESLSREILQSAAREAKAFSG